MQEIKLSGETMDIVEDNEDKLPDDDREEVEDIVADLKENMAKIVEHGERAISIIQGILLVSRGKENEFIPSDVCRIVKEYVWLSYHAMRANIKNFNISIHEQYENGIPPMMVIPQDLSRAVLNIMNNACYAVWQKSQEVENYKPEISVSVSTSDGHYNIVIRDNGIGIEDTIIDKIFDPFFTTKPTGEAAGVGLYLSREIIQNLSGDISVKSEKDVYTEFTITLPILQN